MKLKEKIIKKFPEEKRPQIIKISVRPGCRTQQEQIISELLTNEFD